MYDDGVEMPVKLGGRDDRIASVIDDTRSCGSRAPRHLPVLLFAHLIVNDRKFAVSAAMPRALAERRGLLPLPAGVGVAHKQSICFALGARWPLRR